MDGNNITLTKDVYVNLDSTSQTTASSSGGQLAYDNKGYIYFRVSLTYNYNNLSGTPGVSITNVSIDSFASSGWLTNTRGVSFLGLDVSLARPDYSSTYSVSKSYPKGSTFYTNTLSSAWQSVAKCTISNARIKPKESSITTSILCTATIKVFGTVEESVTKTLKCSFSIHVPRTQYTLKYLKEDGSVHGSPVTQVYNSSITIKEGYTKQQSNNGSSGQYKIEFYSDGGTEVDDRYKNWSWSSTTTYTFSSWGGYPPGTKYILKADVSLKAKFISNTTPATWTRQTFGSLPTVYKKGYESTNVWYYSAGTRVDPSDEVKSDLTVYCKWEFPKTYQIDFNLNGGRIPEEYDQSIKNYSLSKMYGTSVKAPSFTPYRLGYSFAGWSDQTGSLAKVQPNGNIDDKYYNKVNGDQTNINVTLYAQWTPKVNTIYFRYYLADNGDLKTDTVTYTIERADKTVTKNAPKSLRGGDFAFLGWCDQKPRGWDKSSYANNGYHGTYTLPPEKVVDEDGNEIDVELPVTIDINKLTKLEDWGVTEEYYGIWAKSGKYIKISNSWRKVVRSYVKIGGEWKLVRDIWTKQGGAWKHEI